jgi:fructose-bisphosphate aldolase class I
MSTTKQQMQKMKKQRGIIAALDQSDGSTPHALALYGIKDHAWKDDDEMFDLVHQMRTRVITSPSFTGERIIAAILFEDTMDRDIEGQATADFLWNVKRVVPFLKVDKGLQPEKDGVQLLKPMPDLTALLDKGKTKHISPWSRAPGCRGCAASSGAVVSCTLFALSGAVLPQFGNSACQHLTQ